MKHFTSVNDVTDVNALVLKALQHKHHPFRFPDAGKQKTLGLIFMNPSLRTRLSTQKAAMNLGLSVMVMNMDKEGWALELEDGAVMNIDTVEHIKDAAAVMGQYCDIIGVRCFAALKDKETDYAELLLNQLKKYAHVPVVSLESATLHPLQSLADMITIQENTKVNTSPKVVLCWAPHVKPLPQAVANSFAQWVLASGKNLTITHPEGMELDEQFTKGAQIEHNQRKALAGADFVYVKNWSSYLDYGKLCTPQKDWLLSPEHITATNNAHIMHCLPVRRNVELSDTLIDSQRSLIQQQAANRVVAAQTILYELLHSTAHG